MVSTDGHRYINHSDGGQVCRMSKQHTPIVGDSPREYVGRAYLLADLAEQVQDQDPTLVWDYLTALPAGEVQRLLQIALAAIRVDQTVDEMFSWVTELPVSKVSA